MVCLFQKIKVIGNNKRDFEILFEGGKKLLNQYGIILINEKKCPMIKNRLAMKLTNFLISKKSKTITVYKSSIQI